MSGPVPSFVVAGAGRAGTTGLVEGLRSHPGVFVTTPKEPHYLAMHGGQPSYRGPGDEESINRTAVTDEKAYRALYPSGSDHQALGEASVSTLYHHERALPELLRLNPQVRVVVLLREPVARAYSSFQYLRAQGREPEEDFLVALAKEPGRKADNWHHLWHYSAMSLYADAVAALQQQLAPGHLGLWFHDDLERDYAGTFDDVVRFLGLPPVPEAGRDVPHVNASGVPRFERVHQGMWWVRGQPLLRETARAVTSWRFREAVKSRLMLRVGVPDQVIRAVAPSFAGDLARLRGLLGPDAVLPGWLQAPNGAPAV